MVELFDHNLDLCLLLSYVSRLFLFDLKHSGLLLLRDLDLLREYFGDIFLFRLCGLLDRESEREGERDRERDRELDLDLLCLSTDLLLDLERLKNRKEKLKMIYQT